MPMLFEELKIPTNQLNIEKKLCWVINQPCLKTLRQIGDPLGGSQVVELI